MVRAPREHISTDRLVIRPAGECDRAFLERLLTDPEVRAHLGGPVATRDLEAKIQGLLQEGAFVVDAVDGTVGLITVGLITVGTFRTGKCELSYQFSRDAWGHGYARESCEAVLEWASSIADHIVAVTQLTNRRSRRLLTALGMEERERFIEFGETQVLMSTAPTIVPDDRVADREE